MDHCFALSSIGKASPSIMLIIQGTPNKWITLLHKTNRTSQSVSCLGANLASSAEINIIVKRSGDN